MGCAMDNIVQYIDWFESDNFYYLVIEYVQSEINLEQFMGTAHEYMDNGKLKKREYQQIIKKIMWELVNVIYWLHNDMNCCHLDINLENIMLQNADFIVNELDGTVSISTEIKVKLCDFGRSELFKESEEHKDNMFECAKQGMSLLEDGVSYDAREQDIFDFGMCLYHCCVGIAHDYDDENINEDIEIETNGHSAVRSGTLNDVIKSKVSNKKIINLLTELLKIDETERYQIDDVLKHEWFATYFAKNKKQIHKRSKSQKIKYLKQLDEMKEFPFYDIYSETCPIASSEMIMIQ